MSDSTNPPDPLFSVDGRTVVVTGGSRGVGALVAEGLAAAGAHVVITGRDGARCRATAAAITERTAAGRCTAVAADLSSTEGVTALVDRLTGLLRHVDVLVNNAGSTWGAPLEDFPERGWTKVLATNLVAPFYLVVGLLPLLRAAATPARPARVVNIGSVDGLAAPAWENYSYSASKAGLHMLTRQLAGRLASEAVTVNAIAPGPVRTDMLAHVAADPAAEAALLDRVPLGRYGTGDDLVGAVRFLASAAGSYVTGTVLPLDGGLTGCAAR